jgi:hypothetical protein
VRLMVKYALGVKSISFKSRPSLHEKYSLVKVAGILGGLLHTNNGTTIRYAFENDSPKRMQAKRTRTILK